MYSIEHCVRWIILPLLILQGFFQLSGRWMLCRAHSIIVFLAYITAVDKHSVEREKTASTTLHNLALLGN